MDSRRLVDPELAVLARPASVFTAETMGELREREAQLLASVRQIEPPEGVLREDLQIPTDAGRAVRVVHFAPSGQASGPRPAVLQIHGGGFVVGFPEMGNQPNARMAAELQCHVFATSYRHAPEHPFPGALEDCLAVFAWIHENAERLGVDSSRLIVSGQSAGGALAAGLCLRARALGYPPFRLLHMIYPALDDRTVAPGAPRNPYTGEFLWDDSALRFCWQAYLAGRLGAADIPAEAAPGRLDDLSGLPPTFLAVGALDILVDETLEFARILIRSGVSTELHVFPGAPHGFTMLDTSSTAQACTRASLAAMRRALSGQEAGA